MHPRASFFGWTASLLLVLSPLLLATYVSVTGVLVQGEVTAKRELFSMPGGDRWEHVFEVTFRYPLRGSEQIETASHQVDPSLYGRLQIGSPVQVRYSPWRTLRLFNGIGSELAESSWLSRFPHSSLTCATWGISRHWPAHCCWPYEPISVTADLSTSSPDSLSRPFSPQLSSQDS